MKTLKYTNIIVLLFLTSIFGCKIQAQGADSSTLIIGTWVAEGSALSDKWVFETNGILKDYSNNLIDTTYSWTITANTNSGGVGVSYYLKIVNINDTTDIYNFEINTLNDERLVLVWQRGNNMGISKHNIYFRQ